MSEGDMRGRVVRALRQYDAMAVENRVRPGTPDVNYIGGWIELKWIKRWPKNIEESAVRVEHFTPQQRVWLKTRWRKGGRAFLLLQANGSHWYLFDGQTAAHAIGRSTKEQLHKRALCYMHPLDEKELIRWVTMDLQELHERSASLFQGYVADILNDEQPSS